LSTIVGLDLAGVESRPTGFCALTCMMAKTSLIYEDTEILRKIHEINPRVVAIDAPLSLPPGRKSIEERTGVHLRKSDRELLNRGIKFFPVTLGPMRKLTMRGMHLKKILEDKDFVAIEAYPGGAQDVLGIARKQQGLKKLKLGLENLGINGLGDQMSDHELDAVTCAYVGQLFLCGEYITYGDPNQGIVMPKGNMNTKTQY
jgi:predicted nuclease with RNAse H fold